MKYTSVLLCLLPLAAPLGRAEDIPLEEFNRTLSRAEEKAKANSKLDPRLDPKRIINESSSFLKEREPEMSAEEYALYEKVVTMLATKPDFALRILEAMINEKEPPSPAFEFILGNAYYAAGNHEKSEASYRSAVRRYPTFLRAWNNLGVLYYSTQRYAEATASLSKCIGLGDREPMTFGLLGYCLEQEKRGVQAEMAYMQALFGDPDNTDWLEGLFRVCLQSRQYGRAELLVQELIRQNPRELRYWLAYANVLLSQNRKLEAIAQLEVSLGAGIAGPDEISLLADLYAEQKLVPEAIAAYQRVKAATPALGEQKLLNFADLLIYGGNVPQAQQVLDSLDGKLSPAGRITAGLLHADLLMRQNQWPEARAALDEVLKVEPMNGKALLSLGRVYLAEKNLPRAQLAFEAAYQIPDSLYRACLELATLELKKRNYTKTVDYLEQALAIQKSSPVEDFLARVKSLVETKT